MSRPATHLIRIASLDTHPEAYVRFAQVEQYFGVGRKIVMKWIEHGLLKGMRTGGESGEWRFKVDHLRDLERMLSDRAHG